MCARESGTFPEPRLHKRGYLRLRVCGRDFTIGKPGSKQATERHNAIMATWGANNGTLPADFTISEAPKELPQVAVEPAGVPVSLYSQCTPLVENWNGVDSIKRCRPVANIGVPQYVMV